MSAPATPPPAPPGPPQLDYVPTYRVRSNVPALVGLVCGVLLCVPFLSGIPAVILGWLGVRRADELHGTGRRMAQAAIVLGVVNLVISVALVGASFPATARARQQAQRIQCASNLRQISAAMFMYMSSNQNALPPDLDALLPFFGSTQSAAAICTCPGATVHGVPPATVGKAISSSYIYIPPGVARLNQIQSPATTVAVYEPLANHGGRDANVLFWDGHVELLQGAAAQATVARLRAQQAASAATRPSPTSAPAPDEGGNP